MPHYAYRALDAPGNAIRVPLSAPNAEQVLLDARAKGHRVIMLYKLDDDPEPHYEKLMDAPNVPPPPVIVKKRFDPLKLEPFAWNYYGSWNWRSLRKALREGRIQGKEDLYALRLRTESLVQAAVSSLWRSVIAWDSQLLEWLGDDLDTCRENSRRHEDLPRHDREEIAAFRRTPLVKADADFEPPEDIRGWISNNRANELQVVPYARDATGCIFLAGKPEDLHTAEALRFKLDKNVSLARCHADIEQNKAIVKQIIERVYPYSDMESRMEGEIAREKECGFEPGELTGKLKQKVEPWEGTAQGLPPLPVEDESFARSRVGGFLSDHFLWLLDTRDYEDPLHRHAHGPPSHKLCWLKINSAVFEGADRIVLCPKRDRFVTFYYWGDDEVDQEETLGKQLLEPAVLCFGGVVGIQPWELPPAQGQIEVTAANGVRLDIRAQTHMTEFGQQIEVAWRKNNWCVRVGLRPT